MDQLYIAHNAVYKDVITYPYHNLGLSLLIKDDTKMPPWHMLLWLSEYRSSYTGAPITIIVYINQHWDWDMDK